MIAVFLIFWFISAFFIIREHRIIRIFIYFGVFSLITSICFLLLGAPDVAMAEAAINAFTTVFFIVCFEKYYELGADDESGKPRKISAKQTIKTLFKYIPHALFVVLLFALFVAHMPTIISDIEINTYLKYQYIAHFMEDVGGENAVGAIYLGYRIYDTLFEALMLVVGVVAVIHMSEHTIAVVSKGKGSEVQRSGMAIFTIRIICPLLVIFGFYLMANGHISPGGGFQGGLAIAAFFICRYMVYDIYDLPILKVMKLEEAVFVTTVLLAIFVVFVGVADYLPIYDINIFQGAYLMIMNFLIGAKVTCSFIILFYRFIAVERL